MAKPGGQGMDHISACESYGLRTDPYDDGDEDAMMIVGKGGKASGGYEGRMPHTGGNRIAAMGRRSL